MALITHYHYPPYIVHILGGRPIEMRIGPKIKGKIVLCNKGLRLLICTFNKFNF